MLRLTEQAHDFIRDLLTPGAIAIDATAGNGHDTLFLAQAVGPGGIVYAFDLQPIAIEQTASRLEGQGIENVILLQRDHAKMQAAISVEHHGRVSAVMFNLGYLPGGDESLITHTASTVEAVRQSANLLRPGGILTIIAYVGHPGGKEEADAVSNCLNELDPSDFNVDEPAADETLSSPPRLIVVRKQ